MYQTKWGFVPESKEVYTKLKLIKKTFWRSLKELAILDRYLRKQPQNRFKYVPNLSVIAYDADHRVTKMIFPVKDRWETTPLRNTGIHALDDLNVHDMLDQVRKPVADAKDLKYLSQEEKSLIDRLYVLCLRTPENGVVEACAR